MTQTKQNLLKAIAGESMARNKYAYFAEIAEKEGLVWIAKVFLETADNEKAHAQEELEQIQERVEMTNTYDIHPLADTLTNLRNAAEGEKFEWGKMYVSKTPQSFWFSGYYEFSNKELFVYCQEVADTFEKQIKVQEGDFGK